MNMRSPVVQLQDRAVKLSLSLHCIYGFCSSQVSVPSSSMFTMVTVRCGHCANLLSVNMAASLQQIPLQDLQFQKQHLESEEVNKDHSGSSSSPKSTNKFAPFESPEHEQPRAPPIRPPEKRHRVPSAYNRFIKEEIQRIKASNPEISHREAFSTAAKNVIVGGSGLEYLPLLRFIPLEMLLAVQKWAHFPHIHFGLKLDGNNNNNKNKQVRTTLDHPFSGEGAPKPQGLY